MYENEQGQIDDLHNQIMQTLKNAILTISNSISAKEERIKYFRKMNDEMLLKIYKDIALEAEAYEICADAKIVIDERGLSV